MYSNQTYEVILERALNRVSTDVDKREGSLIMNALASSAVEHTNLYILLSDAIKNGYALTAIREYLILRCQERGITPYEATKAVLKGKFNVEIPIGSRFNLNDLNYITTEYIETVGAYHYYQLECETAGTLGNKYFGDLSPIEYYAKNLKGELIDLLIPAEDEEETEALRKRYLDSFNSTAFGGNKRDYVEKVKALEDVRVGGVVVIPTWQGGGTVKLIITDSEFNGATPAMVSAVQEAIDPPPQGTGTGIAPIGHTVTVVSATAKIINISFRLTFADGYTWAQIEDSAIEAIGGYLAEMRENWESGGLIVRISQVENRVLNIDGVIDIADTMIGTYDDEGNLTYKSENLMLEQEEIPVLGGVTNG